MPELPEVEVVRRGLEPVVRGARVEDVQVLDSRSLKRHRGPVEDFVHLLSGSTLEAAVRRGKFLWFPLAGTKRALVGHLGMSGQMLLSAPGQTGGKHLRVRLELSTDTGENASVCFVDQRIFGSLAVDEVVATSDAAPGGFGSDLALLPRSVAHIARDPLDPFFDDVSFAKKLASKNTGIKRALLDQNLISGIGNIYADEALFGAKLHYATPANRLAPARVRALLAEVREVLRRALAEGGTSFDQQYVNVNGESGYFSRSLKVYGRAGENCERCGGIIRREPFMNRSSHLCPRCQKMPRNR